MDVIQWQGRKRGAFLFVGWDFIVMRLQKHKAVFLTSSRVKGCSDMEGQSELQGTHKPLGKMTGPSFSCFLHFYSVTIFKVTFKQFFTVRWVCLYWYSKWNRVCDYVWWHLHRTIEWSIDPLPTHKLKKKKQEKNVVSLRDQLVHETNGL